MRSRVASRRCRHLSRSGRGRTARLHLLLQVRQRQRSRRRVKSPNSVRDISNFHLADTYSDCVILDRLSESWSSPAYAFFEPTPEIKYVNGRRCHEFLCSAPGCKTTVRRFVDTATPDNSTGNLFKHARKCWGTQVVQDAVAVKDQGKIREGLAAAKTLKDGTITAMFDRAAGKGAVTYQAKPLTYSETRVESVCWVAESMRPASVLEDRRFLRLMKSGRPSMKIPSARTVQRDAHRVFKRVKGRIAELLQTYDGRLSFATDAWTSPNH
ncbi:hypothetical protein DFP72DRAFT_824418, partial [Ephemerocybe angulata]